MRRRSTGPSPYFKVALLAVVTALMAWSGYAKFSTDWSLLLAKPNGDRAQANAANLNALNTSDAISNGSHFSALRPASILSTVPTEPTSSWRRRMMSAITPVHPVW